MTMNVEMLRPGYTTGGAITHVCLSLGETMGDESTNVRYWVVTSTPQVSHSFVKHALPPFTRKVIYRYPLLQGVATSYLFQRYLSALRPGDIAYLWPGTPLSVYEAARRRGAIVVSEMINCFQGFSKRILDDEYERLGWPSVHTITELSIAVERAQLALSDYVFAPSPAVYDSLIDSGVPPSHIIRSSYGWDPRRFTMAEPAKSEEEGLTALFVGRLSVRKGLHLLLDYWEGASLQGKLLLDGKRLDEDIRTHCASQLARRNVIHLGFTRDVAKSYRAADVFVFPTLEEGSPLVTYEAMGCGLPLIVSPMGAGDVVRDGVDGFVIDPHDGDAWIAALKRLAEDSELRAKMGRSARQRAQQYTWSNVGAARRALLSDRRES